MKFISGYIGQILPESQGHVLVAFVQLCYLLWGFGVQVAVEISS